MVHSKKYPLHCAILKNYLVHPCQLITYDIGTQSYDSHSGMSLLRDPNTNRSTRELYIYYQTTTVVVSKEILVMGFWDFVSACGGSMGLFLGFSFFSCGSDLIYLCKKGCLKRSNPSRSNQHELNMMTNN